MTMRRLAGFELKTCGMGGGFRGAAVGLVLWGVTVFAGGAGLAQEAVVPVEEGIAGEVAGGVRVPEINEAGVMTSLLTGREVRFRPRLPMEITELRIYFYEEDGRTVRMRADSPACFYDSVAGRAFSEEPIRIEGEEFVITGTRYAYEAAAQTMEIQEDVKVVLKNVNFGAVAPSAAGADDSVDSELEVTP